MSSHKVEIVLCGKRHIVEVIDGVRLRLILIPLYFEHYECC